LLNPPPQPLPPEERELEELEEEDRELELELDEDPPERLPGPPMSGATRQTARMRLRNFFMFGPFLGLELVVSDALVDTLEHVLDVLDQVDGEVLDEQK
jgi:hypothetical protein